MCEGFKLAYADFLLRCDLLGPRASLLQSDFLGGETRATKSAAGEVAIPVKSGDHREGSADGIGESSLSALTLTASDQFASDVLLELLIVPLAVVRRDPRSALAAVHPSRVSLCVTPSVTNATTSVLTTPRPRCDMLGVQPPDPRQVFPQTLHLFVLTMPIMSVSVQPWSERGHQPGETEPISLDLGQSFASGVVRPSESSEVKSSYATLIAAAANKETGGLGLTPGGGGEEGKGVSPGQRQVQVQQQRSEGLLARARARGLTGESLLGWRG